jgi:hypothetical protein
MRRQFARATKSLVLSAEMLSPMATQFSTAASRAKIVAPRRSKRRSKMAIKVAHWGVGQTGRLALQGVIGHPGLELVGVCVSRPENAGRDAGDLCDRPKTGIVATTAVDAVLALKPDCLSYFGPGMAGAAEGVENVARFLEAGVDVVTTSLGSLIHPDYAPKDLRERLEAACRKGGASFFATGIEPGYASDILPMVLLSATDRIDEVRVIEIADYARYVVE